MARGRTRPRTTLAVIAVVLVGVSAFTFAVVDASPADACFPPPPMFSVTPAEGRPGDQITVAGSFWILEPPDTDDDCTAPQLQPPSVDITWEQAGTTTVLADDVPLSDHAFAVTVDIPADATVGAATVAATPPTDSCPTCTVAFAVVAEPDPTTSSPTEPSPAPIIAAPPRFTG